MALQRLCLPAGVNVIGYPSSFVTRQGFVFAASKANVWFGTALWTRCVCLPAGERAVGVFNVVLTRQDLYVRGKRNGLFGFSSQLWSYPLCLQQVISPLVFKLK